MTTKLEEAARQAFETWWEREGQEFLFALNTTTDDDIKLVAEVAWKNGAYCAEQAEQEPDKPLYRKALREMLDAHEQAEQEPVCIDWDTKTDEPIIGYAASVRTKELSDDEIDECRHPYEGAYEFARAVIAADREKNRG